MKPDSDKWYQDKISENLIQMHRVKEVLYQGQTKFQSIEILRTGSYGKCLVLDHKIQSSEVDEFIYHEALIHPAMISHPRPETVFIAGGGEGATLREILRYDSVKKVVMVDIDEEVISLSKKYLPEYSQGAFEDKRVELYHTDARKFLAESKDSFDIVIIDLTEPVEEGPAYLLYTQEFYRIVKDKLTSHGIISVQAGSASYTELLNLSSVYNTLKTAFPEVYPFQVDIPSFGGPWGFCLAFLNNNKIMSINEIDKRIKERSLKNLRLYDGLSHQCMFSLTRHLRDKIISQKRIITDNQPLYTYTGG
jgi:spermidine synthase